MVHQLPKKKTQSISFAQPGLLTKAVYTTFSNVASGGSGTGSIVYAVSDTSIATVSNTTGLVTPLTTGRVTIKATKAADETYEAVSASYTLDVVINDYPFTGWILGGASNPSWFLFDDVANGHTLVGSTNENCDPSTGVNCDDLIESELSGAWVSDSSIKLATNSWFWLKDEVSIYSDLTKVTTETLSARAYHGAAVFDKKMWVIGGRNDTEVLKDVWSSVDGMVWEPVADDPAMGLLYRHQAASFDGKLWVIGGKTGLNSEDVTSAVYVSEDGSNWIPFEPLPKNREGHRVAVLGHKLWVIGGRDETGAYQKSVYSIPAGAVAETKWDVQDADDIGFSARTDFALFVLDDRIWITGGLGSSGIAQDLWSFDGDGSWREESTDIEFGGRVEHKVTALGDELYMVGGTSNTATLNDVWKTVNGTTWVKVPGSSPYSKRQAFELLSFESRLWVVGGGTVVGSALSRPQNDTWTTVDGIAWNQVTLESSISARSDHASIVFQGEMWTIGGKDGANEPLGDIWSSSDGVRWNIRVFEAPFGPRYGHALAVFNDALWVIGGRGSDGRLNDVWSSPDGLTWSEHAIPSGELRFSARAGLQVVSFDGKLWLIAGEDGSGLKDDVWNSTDGSRWVNVVDIAPFSKRSEHELLVFMDKLWVIGGRSDNDVWSSSNGIDWSPIADNVFADDSKRSGFSAGILNDKMYVMGGLINGTSYDMKVFRSSDGNIWYPITSGLIEQPAFEGREGATLVVFENQLHFMGGSTGSRLLHDVWRSSDGLYWFKGYQNAVRFPVIL